MKIFIFICLFLNVNNNQVLGKNILFLDELLLPSHQIWNYKIVEELLNRGHNVTLVGPKTIKPIKHQNYTMIELTDMANTVTEKNMLDPHKIQKYRFFKNLQLSFDYVTYTCEDAWRSPQLKKLFEYPKDFKFDLLIVDISLGGGCLHPFIQIFNYPPTIAVMPLLLEQHASEAFGNVVNPSYLPHIFSDLPDDMTFLDRVKNYVYLKYDIFLRTYFYRPFWTTKIKSFYGGDIDFNSLEKHISLVLCNIMIGFHYARPLTPNIIPVGGLHIKQKELPKDLQDILDKSENGVILFALGTLVRTEEFDSNKVQMILEALGKLNETVIWKMDSDLIKNVPKNVLIRKWLPQGDILAHPKTKAFVSHCGGLSTMEAVHYGVPVIGLPFFADQHHIGAQLKSQKIGTVLDFTKMTADDLYNAIQEIVHNPMYGHRAKEISAIVRDQPKTPLERAIFWIEWSMRHNNTESLQPRSRYLSLFVLSSFDVYLFFLVVFVVFLFILKKINSLFITDNKNFKNSKLKSN